MSDVNKRFELAKAIAIEAGKSTLDFFQQDNFEVIKKQDGSPLTLADQTAEKLLRAEIEKHFPDDGIVGEEFGVKESNSKCRWILDPIDGTKSFITGVPLYGTMVGVEVDGEATIGVCFFPGLDEGIFACTGGGAFAFQGSLEQCAEAKVSSKSDLSDCVMVTSNSATFAQREKDDSAVWSRLDEAVYFSRTWGDAYGYMLVATGRVEIMIDPILSIWDTAAVKPIIEEAGGKFTDWSGNVRIDAGEAVGTNSNIHAEVLRLINSEL